MSILFLDIETLPAGADQITEYGVLPHGVADEQEPEFSAPANYKDPVKVAQYIMDQHRAWHADRWSRFAARSLSPMTGQIACIGIAVDTGDVRMIDCMDAHTEADALAHLYGALADASVVVTHHGESFDLPFIGTRAAYHGMPDLMRRVRVVGPGRLLGRESWDLANVWPCSNDARFRGKVPGSSKLTAIADFLGLDTRFTTSGADVLRQYVTGDRRAILSHCARDVSLLRDIFTRCGAVPGFGDGGAA